MVRWEGGRDGEGGGNGEAIRHGGKEEGEKKSNGGRGRRVRREDVQGEWCEGEGLREKQCYEI